MALKLSDSIETMRPYLEWFQEYGGMIAWRENTAEYKKEEFDRLQIELRVAHRICSCAEMFFFRDLPAESQEEELDQSLESLFYRHAAAIDQKTWELYRMTFI